MPSDHRILFGPLPPPYGGVSVFMSQLYQPVMDSGAEVWSYTRHDPSRFPAARYLDHRRLGHLAAVTRAPRNSRVIDSTHFHLEYPHPLLVRLWLRAKRLRNFRWINVLHDGSLPFRFARFTSGHRSLFGKALKAVDEMVVVTDELASFCTGQRPDLSVRVIPSLLPPTPKWLEVKPDAAWLPALERHQNHIHTVCCLGAFIPSYGFAEVANAIEHLRAQTSQDIGLMLIAGSFAADDVYRRSIVEHREWITVVTDVPHHTLASFYRGNDVFVRAFEHESYGLSRVEAIWCGVPVIATDIGETRGMLTYDFNDTARLAELIGKILTGNEEQPVGEWSDVFHREAGENIAQWLNVIRGDSNA